MSKPMQQDQKQQETPAIEAFFDKISNTVTYLVWDKASRSALIIDPVLDFSHNNGKLGTASADALITILDERKLKLTHILDTHAHADHLSAGDYIRRKTGALYGIGAHITDAQKHFRPFFNASDVATDGSVFDLLFADGDQFRLGALTVDILHTPGHTSACVSYLIGDAIFVGDTLFMPDFGTARTDFPGGSAKILYRSIQKIFQLADDTRLFTGHDYKAPGRNHYAWESSVKAQRETNIHIGNGISEAEFIDMREKRDASLEAPKLILPSLQVNIRGGQLPPKESDGRHYLRLPVTPL